MNTLLSTDQTDCPIQDDSINISEILMQCWFVNTIKKSDIFVLVVDCDYENKAHIKGRKRKDDNNTLKKQPITQLKVI